MSEGWFTYLVLRVMKSKWKESKRNRIKNSDPTEGNDGRGWKCFLLQLVLLHFGAVSVSVFSTTRFSETYVTVTGVQDMECKHEDMK